MSDKRYDTQVIVGLDVGNGYVKGKAAFGGYRGPYKVELIDMPSTLCYTTGVDIPTEPTEDLMGRLYNELDATIVSKVLSSDDAGRVFLGERAIRTGDSLRQFDINNHQAKCQDALSTMLILGSLASVAVKHYWFRHGQKKLPQSLKVQAALGIALPINDFLMWKDAYRNSLMKHEHHVMIHNFEHNIDVTIEFADVEVLAEGAAAQFAIQSLGADFLQLALDEARKNGAELDPGYTGAILAQAQNTIGIDIGEGTVNFPVFTNGQVNIESSSSINKGYGTVLTKVVDRMSDSSFFDTRKDLADFMLKQTVMPAQRAVRAKAEKLIADEVRVFVQDIMAVFSKIFRRVGNRTDVIYIYGGGSAQVKDVLYPKVLQAATLGDDSRLPVIYLDASYSRDLNRTGLYQVADLGARAVGMVMPQ